jgi:chromosome segregation ATPase
MKRKILHLSILALCSSMQASAAFEDYMPKFLKNLFQKKPEDNLAEIANRMKKDSTGNLVGYAKRGIGPLEAVKPKEVLPAKIAAPPISAPIDSDDQVEKAYLAELGKLDSTKWETLEDSSATDGSTNPDENSLSAISEHSEVSDDESTGRSSVQSSNEAAFNDALKAIEYLQKKNEDLKNRHKDLQKEKREIQTRYEDLASQNKKEESLLQKADREISSLKEKVSVLSAEKEANQTKYAAYEQALQRMEEALQARNAEIQDQHRLIAGLRKSLAEAIESKETQAELINYEKEKIGSSENAVHHKNALLQSEKEDLANQLAALQEEKSKILSDMDYLKELIRTQNPDLAGLI